MLNFLQQQNKKKIIFEYSLRVITCFLVIILVSSLILISLFVPSFFFVKYKNEAVNMQLESSKQENINKGEDPAISIKDANGLAVSLADSAKSSLSYSDIIKKIVSLKNKDIKISSIVITVENDTGGKKILINGIANTRDSLTSFDKDIMIDGSFSNVTFPVSNFIKSTNSEFSATLIL